MDFVYRKAQRAKAKARIGFVGPAGSGKSHSGLLFAAGLAGDNANKRRPGTLLDPKDPTSGPMAFIVVADTEHESASMEEGKPGMPEFDHVILEPPYDPAKYIAFLKSVAAKGYEVCVLDGISPAWAGVGGLLDKQGKMVDRGTNSFSAWRNITPQHNEFIDEMIRAPFHVIATMRSKTEWVLTENDKGKLAPKKVGLAPVQREGMDYEFTLVFDVDQATHTVAASKDRTSLFDGKDPFRVTPKDGEMLRLWLDKGVEAPPRPDYLKADVVMPPARAVEQPPETAPTATGRQVEAPPERPAEPEPTPPPEVQAAANGAAPPEAQVAAEDTGTENAEDEQLITPAQKAELTTMAKARGLVTIDQFKNTLGARPSTMTVGKRRLALKILERMPVIAAPAAK